MAANKTIVGGALAKTLCNHLKGSRFYIRAKVFPSPKESWGHDSQKDNSRDLLDIPCHLNSWYVHGQIISGPWQVSWGGDRNICGQGKGQKNVFFQALPNLFLNVYFSLGLSWNNSPQWFTPARGMVKGPGITLKQLFLGDYCSLNSFRIQNEPSPRL